jgi:DNA-binding MarR family transcriptional regulator
VPRPITHFEYRALADFRAALRGFLRFSEQKASAIGLAPQQHQVLLIVRASESPPTIGDIGAALFLKPNSASELVQRLRASGLVTLNADPADHRRRTLSLTAGAVEVLDSLSEAHRDELRRMRPALKALLDALE